MSEQRAYIFILCVATIIYFAPLPEYRYWMLDWFHVSSISTLFSIVCFASFRTKLLPLVIVCEFVAQFSLASAFNEHVLASKSQWFYANITTIMTTCYALEIIVLTMGVIGLDRLGRILRSLRAALFGHESIHRIFHTGEKCL